jgi:DNA replication protein DnaC
LICDAGSRKRIDDFDFTANPFIDPGLIHTLVKGASIRAGQPLCLIDDSRTGKSHLLISLGIVAAEAGHRVRYVTAAALVNELVEASDDKHLSRTIAPTAASTCCVSTNLGCAPQGAEETCGRRSPPLVIAATG